MSNSAVFNKKLCHSSNRVTIKNGFSETISECPILTKLFLTSSLNRNYFHLYLNNLCPIK